jgi:hypothetical protein
MFIALVLGPERGWIIGESYCQGRGNFKSAFSIPGCGVAAGAPVAGGGGKWSVGDEKNCMVTIQPPGTAAPFRLSALLQGEGWGWGFPAANAHPPTTNQKHLPQRTQRSQRKANFENLEPFAKR